MFFACVNDDKHKASQGRVGGLPWNTTRKEEHKWNIEAGLHSSLDISLFYVTK